MRLPDLVRSRSFGNGLYTALLVMTVSGIIILCSYLFERIGQTYQLQIDLTRNKAFTLDAETTRRIKELTTDIEILAFYPPGKTPDPRYPVARVLGDLLKQYAFISRHFTFRFVDPAQEFELVKAYKVSENFSLVAVAGDQHVEIPLRDYFHMQQIAANQPPIPEFRGEAALTSALIRVTSEPKHIAFLTGHHEYDIDNPKPTERGYGYARYTLERVNYSLSKLNLQETGKIPDDIDTLVIASPQRQLIPAEVDLLRSYLNDGGRLLFLSDPLTTTGLESFFGELGVTIQDDVVVDLAPKLFYSTRGSEIRKSYATTLSPTLKPHDITHPLKDGNLLLVGARSLAETPAKEKTTLPTRRSFLETTADSIGETSKPDAQGKLNVKFEQGVDYKGPLSVGMSLQRAIPQVAGQKHRTDEMRVVIIGDADFASNGQIINWYNQDLLINAVAWLSGKEADIAIRPKTGEFSRIEITNRLKNGVLWFTMLIMPGAVVTIGAIVFFRRRNQ